ncbi:MAG: hypothetical protein A2V69_01540 [Candidatus Portnoybacteria bacterium RBG_13_40_8]|uniref:PseI/NeuA/B-like domain-containing protein n=1 Tax=Candidatus Portnoybacteria bacterium RBG_13_40_8 TaxID=1801990 RepID=A0A1G2F5Y8_9BACT|nr:MAG: hypothetical protein A2V69_01540 [Candidatus Portnoybacteria bacterium RBG_13_40_8]
MFISEIGKNYKGSETRAFKMLKKLISTDIDAITFQVVEPTYYDKIKKWGGPLSKNFYKNAIDFVHKNNKLIGFAITDKKMISFLNSAGADFWKSLSTSILDDALLSKLQKTNKPIFVSTGISSEKEIIKMSKKLKNIKFIHTQLSRKIEDTNLKAIDRLRRLTNKKIAFGLHCSEHNILYLSVAFEPSDIFFYVKDNSQEKFPDDEHAIIIDNVDNLVKTLKKLKKSLGSGIKEKLTTD